MLSKSNLLFTILGASTVTLGTLLFSMNADKIMPNSTHKVSGVVDRIGSYGNTVFLLKDNKTSFYIENNTKSALTKPGDQVEFTVTTIKKELGSEESVNRSSFVNLNLQKQLAP